ncbi:MAG: prepilin-type N-terminal cleavage/methylation domain-containing protein [Cloacibacillus porcorum]|uniref:prepilin-type N-terminal cleavage/methylation domain-containing protein n=1 Tax=Cloacibacillus porcorum TaxID=1197717 RepID=UPI0023EFAD90|nr:prepilin-type N-terminal cleavage/methylation domain-containing protein [Cloacibacillus porcorum]MCD7877569.1 prepilin-type N-terminal cleavage/methylation domain-containing protein [Cloacibacillus porcorum]
MREDARKAFTLVEMLIVIIVIGILAALMMISSGSATDKAEETRCIADRRSIRSAINIYRVEHGSYDGFGDKLKEMFDNYHGSDPVDSKIEGICPSGGTYTITSADDKITIICSIPRHEKLRYYTDEEIKNMFSRLHETAAYKDRYVNSNGSFKNTGTNGSVDSNGRNIAPTFLDDLRALFPGLDLSAYSWRIITWDNGRYNVYLTKDKFDNNTAVGTPISAVKYTFDSNGNLVESREVSTTVVEKTVSGEDPIKVIQHVQ